MRINISVIIPAYNAVNDLKNAVERLLEVASNLEITKIYFEVIAVINGATAAAPESAWSRNHPVNVEVKEIYFEEKKTPSDCRNIGIKECRGEYIFFHDADDLTHKNFSKILIDLLDRNLLCPEGPDLFIFNYEKLRGDVYEEENHGMKKDLLDLTPSFVSRYVQKYIREPYKYTMFVHCWNKLYKTAFLEQNSITFNGKLDQLEDVDFNFKCILRCPSILYFPATSYEYIVSQSGNNLSSLSGTKGVKDVLACITAYRSVKKYLETQHYTHEEVKAQIRHLYASTIILWLLRIGKRSRILPWKTYIELIKQYIKSPLTQACLRHYKVMPGATKLVPKLLRFKATILLGLFLYVKGHN